MNWLVSADVAELEGPITVRAEAPGLMGALSPFLHQLAEDGHLEHVTNLYVRPDLQLASEVEDPDAVADPDTGLIGTDGEPLESGDESPDLEVIE